MRPSPAWAAVVGCLLLAACGGGAEPTVAPSTVTVTASTGAPASEPEGTDEATGTSDATGEPSAAASQEPSADADVLAGLPRQDRGYDVGLVDEVREVDGARVLVFDRLTVVGLDDGTLAAEGSELYVDDGSRFTNQTVRLYEVGVSPEARFFLTTCTAGDSGPSISTDPVSADTFFAADGLDGTAVNLVYDDGLLVRAETNPRC